MKKIFLLLLLIPLGLPLFATNPTYIISYKNGENLVSTVKHGDQITIIASFSEALNNAFTPKIALMQDNGNPTTLSSVNMTLVDSVTYTYNWTVGIGDGNLIPNVTIARNMANEVVSNSGSIQTAIKVDNTIPVLAASTIGVDVRYHGALKVTDSLVFNFSEGLKTMGNHVVDDINLRLGGKQGSVVSYVANLSNDHKQITLKPSVAMECYNGTNLYYIGFPDSTFSDSVGNVLALKEIVFHPDSVDIQPIITGATTGTDGLNFCPENLLTCANPDMNLQYQWMFNGTAITGETALQFSLPLADNGDYKLQITNPLTTCVNFSNAKPITIYPTAYPTFIEKKEHGVINLLVVDNSADLYVSYKWKKGDGSTLDANTIDNRQFLTLSGTTMNGDYKVIATDIFGCNLSSEAKNITVKKSMIAFPSVNNGRFNVVIAPERKENVIVRIYSLQGIEVYHTIYATASGTSSIDLDLSDVNSGVYIVELQYTNAKESQQIIIQN